MAGMRVSNVTIRQVRRLLQPENGDSMFLEDVATKVPNYTESHRRIPQIFTGLPVPLTTVAQVYFLVSKFSFFVPELRRNFHRFRKTVFVPKCNKHNDETSKTRWIEYHSHAWRTWYLYIGLSR
jgi:hypothetical protein